MAAGVDPAALMGGEEEAPVEEAAMADAMAGGEEGGGVEELAAILD